MALSGLEIARMAAEFKKQQPALKPSTAKTPERVKIIAGSKKIGDTINGNVITGLGKSWSQFIPDHETSAWGLQPGQNYRLDVQYAYFN